MLGYKKSKVILPINNLKQQYYFFTRLTSSILQGEENGLLIDCALLTANFKSCIAFSTFIKATLTSFVTSSPSVC